MNSAVSDIRTTFRDDPGVEDNGHLALVLKRQLDGYKNADPPHNHQKTLPVRIFKYLSSNFSTRTEEAIGQLTTTEFFFAMRSCEYSSVRVPGRTELIRLNDIKFSKNKYQLDSRFDDIKKLATSVTIIFRNQKNGEKGAMVTQHRNTHDLCPVKSLARLTKRILSYKDTIMTTTMNTVLIDGKLIQLRSEFVLQCLREVVTLFGPDDLGFTAQDIGTNSIQSSTAMQLGLSYKNLGWLQGWLQGW